MTFLRDAGAGDARVVTRATDGDLANAQITVDQRNAQCLRARSERERLRVETILPGAPVDVERDGLVPRARSVRAQGCPAQTIAVVARTAISAMPGRTFGSRTTRSFSTERRHAE